LLLFFLHCCSCRYHGCQFPEITDFPVASSHLLVRVKGRVVEVKALTASRQQSLSSSISQSAVTLQCVAAFCFVPLHHFEIARVLVRFDHIARCIVNADLSAI
jgi:hypothetical protein